MTQEEFERRHADRSGVSLEEFRSHWIGLPCECGNGGCPGWAAIERDPYRIGLHLKMYAPQELAELKEALEIIESVPLIMIDARAARRKGETELLEYAQKLIDWFPKAKAFTEKHKDHS